VVRAGIGINFNFRAFSVTTYTSPEFLSDVLRDQGFSGFSTSPELLVSDGLSRFVYFRFAFRSWRTNRQLPPRTTVALQKQEPFGKPFL